MTGPQPCRDYPPPTPARSKIAQWAIDGIKTVAICAAVLLTLMALADAIVS